MIRIANSVWIDPHQSGTSIRDRNDLHCKFVLDQCDSIRGFDSNYNWKLDSDWFWFHSDWCPEFIQTEFSICIPRRNNSDWIDPLQSGASIRFNPRSEWFALQIRLGSMRFIPENRSEFELKTWFRFVLISFWMMLRINPDQILNLYPRSKWFGLQISRIFTD